MLASKNILQRRGLMALQSMATKPQAPKTLRIRSALQHRASSSRFSTHTNNLGHQHPGYLVNGPCFNIPPGTTLNLPPDFERAEGLLEALKRDTPFCIPDEASVNLPAGEYHFAPGTVFQPAVLSKQPPAEKALQELTWEVRALRGEVGTFRGERTGKERKSVLRRVICGWGVGWGASLGFACVGLYTWEMCFG